MQFAIVHMTLPISLSHTYNTLCKIANACQVLDRKRFECAIYGRSFVHFYYIHNMNVHIFCLMNFKLALKYDACVAYVHIQWIKISFDKFVVVLNWFPTKCIDLLRTFNLKQQFKIIWNETHYRRINLKIKIECKMKKKKKLRKIFNRGDCRRQNSCWIVCRHTHDANAITIAVGYSTFYSQFYSNSYIQVYLSKYLFQLSSLYDPNIIVMSWHRWCEMREYWSPNVDV